MYGLRHTQIRGVGAGGGGGVVSLFRHPG